MEINSTWKLSATGTTSTTTSIRCKKATILGEDFGLAPERAEL